MERARTPTGRLESEKLERLAPRYTAMPAPSRAEHPLPVAPRAAGRHGRAKPTPAQNLLDQMEQHRPALLACRHDFRVPFD
ncbi:MAG TPA: hypothetical protein DCM14_00195 [Clostridiales bacterium UBA8153]|nr:hypothetical protein [Clostridiales bacterium UBA8153]